MAASTQLPPGVTLISVITPSLNLLMIGTVWASMLIPLLLVLLFFSTPTVRRQPIFLMNVFTVVTGIVIGALNIRIYAHSIISPPGTFAARSLLAYLGMILYLPLIIDGVLAYRVYVVYPPRHTGVRISCLIFGPIVLLKIARFVNITMFMARFSSVLLGSNQITAITQFQNLWDHAPYTKIEWILQVVDNCWIAALFLWRLGRRAATAATSGAVHSGAEKIKQLFYLALGSFLFPCMFSVAQIIVTFRDHDFFIGDADALHAAAYLFVTNLYIEIIGLLLATIWVSKGRMESESGPSTYSSGHGSQLSSMAFRSKPVASRPGIGVHVRRQQEQDTDTYTYPGTLSISETYNTAGLDRTDFELQSFGPEVGRREEGAEGDGVIATSTPVLWTSFPLPVFRKPSSTRSMSLDITNLALERSYPLPLDVDLRAMALFPGAANVLEYLENTAFRWRSFHMLFYHDELRALSRMSVDTFDSLETLSLQSTAAITWDVPPLDLFLRAPRLRKATLHIDEDIWDESCTVTSRILLPWAQLTHLTLTLNSARMCFDILTRCENLVTATITADNNSGFGADNSHLSAEANLAFLETLSITIEYSGRVDELDEAFAVLRLPALKTLSISRFPALANTTSFRTFLAHAPNIERLDSEFVLEYRHLVAVLPRMRNLTALGLHHFREHYDLLNALRVPMAPETETEAETETLLPRLTSLHLGGYDRVAQVRAKYRSTADNRLDDDFELVST
ncbi:hypothetical protein MKEN_01268000 [Mycena kentingensis (nom. inval.)]|nr:hypothetical protein MKEN_01268000 [Mycena kentingensis (nom. inval.)]